MDPLQLNSVALNPLVFGVLVGTVHHIKFQCPCQAPIFETLWGYGLLLFGFTIYRIIALPIEIVSLLKDLALFDVTYVSLLIIPAKD
jgi:hypothetical protein